MNKDTWYFCTHARQGSQSSQGAPLLSCCTTLVDTKMLCASFYLRKSKQSSLYKPDFARSNQSIILSQPHSLNNLPNSSTSKPTTIHHHQPHLHKMSAQRPTTTTTSSSHSDPKNMLLIVYSLTNDRIQIFSGEAATADGITTRVTELTIRNSKDVDVTRDEFNPATGNPRQVALGKTEWKNEFRVIELVKEAVRDHRDVWFRFLPGMIEELGYWLEPKMVKEGEEALMAHFTQWP
ncbi:hypothetical protein BJY00DRAFT_30372 [Aspergillus carlsbadensis]|nr:hypothetical protein BJY00DRAFT_30372 [Aspergillus carlsbadensis]